MGKKLLCLWLLLQACFALNHNGQMTVWFEQTAPGRPNQLGVRYLPEFYFPEFGDRETSGHYAELDA
ncbi:MAG: hypothetical protein LBD99_05290, partial [Candidatus Margulisbacteria bacterium]|nr:hypothetical protein [Candidatus Margulisiibacteriota bacterium]